MAGDRQLVPTNEGSGTYRAQNDSSFQRNVKVVPSTGYQWIVYTTDGQIHHFGDLSHTSTCTIVSDGYAPLTRSADAFGNTVDYFYEQGSAGECRIKSITWGENANASQGLFASIAFTYSTVDGCQPNVFAGLPPPTATPAQGSQMSYRTGTKIVTGASKLDLITIVAQDPVSGGPVHTRQLTLSYDSNESSCTGPHAAYRALHSIQESAWGVDSPRVDLPAEVFTYGSSSLLTTYPPESSTSAPWAPSAPGGSGLTVALENNLSWGYRTDDGRWPTVEATLVDMDGDGLLDRLTNSPVLVNGNMVSCGAAWQRNKGNMEFGDIVPIPLPTLKWGTPLGGQDYSGGLWADPSTPMPETCALNYQLTKYINGIARHDSPPSTNSSD